MSLKQFTHTICPNLYVFLFFRLLWTLGIILASIFFSNLLNDSYLCACTSVCVCLFVCVCLSVCTQQHTYGNLRTTGRIRSLLSLCGPRNGTQVVRFGSKFSYFLSHPPELKVWSQILSFNFVFFVPVLL